MAAGIGAALLAGSVSGCVSTQHKNARARLVADRTLNGRRALRIARRSRDVHVLHVSIVRGRHASAVVVELANRGGRALTDVPVLVGVRDAAGRRVRANGGRGLAWFDTHVPAIQARGTTTWVLVRHRPLPQGRPWAVAGAVATADARVGTLPRIAATASGPPRRGGAAVTLVNRSDIPQYGVQVYAVAQTHGRVVAAGVASVRHLGSRASGSVRVALVGAPGRRTVRVHAATTIFE
ncbi:MAG: hypothetical protein ACTHOE_12340 [Conexibacter sp.]